MKFSYEDLRHIEKLRISLPPSASPQAIELADQFNGELDQLQKRLDEFFENIPDFDPLASDMKDLDKIAKDRRVRKFDLWKAVVQLLQSRVAINGSIQEQLNQASTAAEERLRKLQAEYTDRLSETGLSGQALQWSVGHVDIVREASNVAQQQRTIATSMNANENVNLPAGNVARIQAGLVHRFLAWIADLTEFETRPENPDAPREQPQWRINEVHIPATKSE